MTKEQIEELGFQRFQDYNEVQYRADIGKMSIHVKPYSRRLDGASSRITFWQVTIQDRQDEMEIGAGIPTEAQALSLAAELVGPIKRIRELARFLPRILERDRHRP